MESNEVLDMDMTQDPSQVEIEIESGVDSTPDVTSEIEVEVETPSETKTPKKNKSNFKKLSESNKAKDKRIADLEAQINWTDSEEVEESTASYEKVDLLEFLTETEWAAAYKESIKETLAEFDGISFEKAFAYAKSLSPTESKSHSLFNAKSATVSKKKKVSELTQEEAVKANLNSEQFDTWSNNQNHAVNNPF